MFRFKEENSLAKRVAESQKIISKWPGRVPIIMEKAPQSRLAELPKSKFLCPADYSVQQFIGNIRKKVDLPKDVALFMYVNGVDLVSGDNIMSTIYEQKRDEDGFLYIVLSLIHI